MANEPTVNFLICIAKLVAIVSIRPADLSDTR